MKNISIMGVSRAMFHYQGIPLHFWGEASNTKVYVQNRNPHQILRMRTPEEDFSGKKPDVSHFRIFGSSLFPCFQEIKEKYRVEN